MFGVALSFFVFPVLASTPPPITGGVETDALPAVVALVGVKPDITWDLCTATLIDPYVALTAAHCIEGMENADGYDFELRVGSGLGEPDESFPLDSWIMHPDADVDMALVFLAEPALTSPLPPFAEQLAVDGPEELAKLVGYGRTSTPNKDSGVKRSVDVLVGQVDEQVIFLLDRDELLGACSGDSGGPVLLERDGQWTPVAVMTTIFDWDGDEEACGDATLGLLIYPHLAWIQEEVAAVQPEPEPEGEEPQGDPPEEEGGRFGCSSVGGGSSWPLSFGVLALLFVRRRS